MIRIENRSIMQHKGWMILPILFGISLLVHFLGSPLPRQGDLHYNMNQFHKLQFTFSLSAIMMLGISIMRKDVLKPSYVWMNTLPIGRSLVWLSKWFAGMLYSSLFTLITMIIYILYAVILHLPVQQIILNGLEYILFYELAYALTITVGMTLGTWIRSHMVYIVGLGSWLFGTYIIDFILVGQMHLYPFRLFRLSAYYLNSVWGHEVYGRIWGIEESAKYAIFALVVIIACSTASIHKLQYQEPGKYPRLWKRLAIVSCLLVMISAIPYLMMWKERLGTDGMQQSTAAISESILNSISIKASNAKVIVKQLDDDRLNVDVTISLHIQDKQLPNPEQQLEFQLDQPFRMEHVYVEGEEVEYEHEANVVYVKQPRNGWASNMNVKFIYSMSGIDRMYMNGDEHITHSAAVEAVWLNAGLHWIPVAVSAPSKSEEDVDTALMNADMQVSLQLMGFHNHVYTSLNPVDSNSDSKWSNSYEGMYGNGIAIWSGDFEHVQVKGTDIKIVTTPSNLREAANFAAVLSDAISYYQDWIEVPDRLKQILYMPTDHIAAATDINMHIGNTLLFREYQHNNLDDNRLFNAISYILFNDMNLRQTLSYADPSSVVIDIRNLMLMLVTKELQLPRWGGINMQDEINSRFEVAFNSGKEDQIKDLLAIWYKQTGQRDIDERSYYYHSDDPMPIGWYPIITREEWLSNWTKSIGDDKS